MLRFRATIEKAGSAANAWCVVAVPTDVGRALNGARRVTGTIANAPFDGALIARGGGCKSVLVKRELREALGLRPGHEVEVTLEPDSRTPSIDVPPELTAALEARPDVGRLFLALAPSHRREYADWIATAKKPATKAARVERALALIAQKKHVK